MLSDGLELFGGLKIGAPRCRRGAEGVSPLSRATVWAGSGQGWGQAGRRGGGGANLGGGDKDRSWAGPQEGRGLAVVG